MEKKEWLDKPYNNLNSALRERFGRKVIKLSVDGGFSCPNRDGKLGVGGCIFCTEKGSGEFSGCGHQPIRIQIDQQIELLSDKWSEVLYMVYFQSFSNTYGDLAFMEKQFREALSHPSVIGLAIATRVDCVSDDALKLLEKLNRETYIWVELGLQSIYEKQHKVLNTGYLPSQFIETTKKLSAHGIQVVGHIILGLPDAPKQALEETVNFLNACPINGLKIHMLNVLKGTVLAELYEKEAFPLLDMDDYIKQLLYIIEHLRADIVIHRVTGDGAKELLIAPNWILNKRKVLNTLLKELKKKEIYQGKSVV